MKQSLHYDEMADRLTIQTVQDVQPILEANKRQYDVDNKRHASETMNQVARIPLVAIEKYCNDKGIKYDEFMSSQKLFRAFLNDPENRLFRTKPGRI